MSFIERLKQWLSALEAAVEAVEEGPYGYMDRQISSLHERVCKLENDRSDSMG